MFLGILIIVCLVCIIIAACMIILMMLKRRIDTRKKRWEHNDPEEMDLNDDVTSPSISTATSPESLCEHHDNIKGIIRVSIGGNGEYVTQRRKIALKYNLPVHNLKMNVPSNSSIRTVNLQTIPVPMIMGKNRNLDDNANMTTSEFMNKDMTYSSSSDEAPGANNTTMGVNTHISQDGNTQNRNGTDTTTEEGTKEISSHPSNAHDDDVGLELAPSSYKNISIDALPMNITRTISDNSNQSEQNTAGFI